MHPQPTHPPASLPESGFAAVHRDAIARQAAGVARTLADDLVDALAQVGVDTYFGVVGGAIEPLFNALARGERRGRTSFWSMRSEAGAAFAADGFCRASGRPAVCTGTTGPGISNMITGLMSAHADRVPLIVITPQVSRIKQGRGALQDSSIDGHDLTGMLRECTRYSTVISHAEQLPHKLARALMCLRARPAGPVHLSFPSDVLAGSSAPGSLNGVARSLGLGELGELADGAALERLARELSAASSPVFYVGDDAGPDAASIFEVARRFGGAVVSSPAGKRWIGHDDPAYRGVLGFSGHRSAATAVEQADLVVTFGATFDELSTNAWTVFGETPVWAVDLHLEHAHRCATARPVLASTRAVISRLLAAPVAPGRTAAPCSEVPRPAKAPAALAAKVADVMEVAEVAEVAVADARGPVHPARLMAFLGRKLPDDVAVHVDAGNAFSWSTHHLSLATAGQYRVAMGLSTMCWAIGASVGAAIARRRRTLCIVGDGSMLMSSLELTVAVQHQLPVTYVVLNDGCYGMVRQGQQLGGAEQIGYELGQVDFDALARACGAGGARVESEHELHMLPEACFTSDDGGPWVIDVRIDREATSPMLDRVRGLAVGASGS